MTQLSWTSYVSSSEGGGADRTVAKQYRMFE
jgi:hypothetical protein